MEEELTKKEKRELAKEKKRKERVGVELKSKSKKFTVWIFVLAILGGGGWWLYRGITRPFPGQKVEDLGRQHIEDGTAVDYNSDPPTSGPHYVDWTRAGVYDKPISDGHLVHSLEHGYVIMSYNCAKSASSFRFLVSNVYAHEEDLGKEINTGEGEELVGVWEGQECKSLRSKLTEIYEKKGERKLIVIPRPGLDTKIALSAWTRIDKMGEFDEDRIISFIDSYRNRGPEQTNE